MKAVKVRGKTEFQQKMRNGDDVFDKKGERCGEELTKMEKIVIIV